MPIRFSGHFMCLETGGQVIATARQLHGSCWEVSHWPWVCDRNQAITALTVTELLAGGRDSNDPVGIALRGELR